MLFALIRKENPGRITSYNVCYTKLLRPGIETLTLETRPEYVDWEELEVLSRALKEGETQTTLEVAIGFEAFDDTIRNVV